MAYISLVSVVSSVLLGIGLASFAYESPAPATPLIVIVEPAPSEGPQIMDRHPELRAIERDLASGSLSLDRAVEMVLPILEDEPRLRSGVEAHTGDLRRGVAVMLTHWVEEMDVCRSVCTRND